MYKTIMALAKLTNTHPDDWEMIEGPETGVGVELWFINRRANKQAYTCRDQGELTTEVSPLEAA